MSGFSNVMKGGWHPKGKEGGKESWRGDFKGINQVVGTYPTPSSRILAYPGSAGGMDGKG
jgi:hypothetical protein